VGDVRISDRHFPARAAPIARAGLSGQREDVDMAQRDFDIDSFLARPLTARLATARPAVRPVWYLWEESLFWILTHVTEKLSRERSARRTA
jgi:hypothetical protein